MPPINQELHRYKPPYRRPSVCPWKGDFPKPQRLATSRTCREFLADRRSCEWQESNIPGSFDRQRQCPLMLGTVSRYSSWDDLSSFSREQTESSHILVVDLQVTIRAVPADFPTMKGPALLNPFFKRHCSPLQSMGDPHFVWSHLPDFHPFLAYRRRRHHPFSPAKSLDRHPHPV